MDLNTLRALSNSSDANAQSRVNTYITTCHRKLLNKTFPQALAYFEQLKSSDTGWQLATGTLTNSGLNQSLDDYGKFFCLQVVEVFSKCSYSKADLSQQQAMKSFLSQWIQLQVRFFVYFSI